MKNEKGKKENKKNRKNNNDNRNWKLNGEWYREKKKSEKKITHTEKMKKRENKNKWSKWSSKWEQWVMQKNQMLLTVRKESKSCRAIIADYLKAHDT